MCIVYTCMFDGKQNTKVEKQSWRTRFFLTKLLIFFLLFLFNLFLFNDLINKCKSCFDVLLFYYISRTHTAYRFAPWSTRLLHLCFIWNPKTSLRMWPNGYGVGLWIRRSWVRPLTPTIFSFCARFCFGLQIHDIFSILIFHK